MSQASPPGVFSSLPDNSKGQFIPVARGRSNAVNVPQGAPAVRANASFDSGSCKINATGVPQRISQVDRHFSYALFYGFSGLDAGVPAPNAQNLAIGTNPQILTDIIAPGQTDFPFPPIPIPGKVFSLKDIWVIGTAGDSIYFSLIL